MQEDVDMWMATCHEYRCDWYVIVTDINLAGRALYSHQVKARHPVGKVRRTQALPEEVSR